MASIPANVLTVDPATVAEAWDINPAVTQAPVPAVTAVSPGGGVPAGGTSVNIMGSGFTGAAQVAFGSTQATSFTVNSDNEITATAPPGSGTDDVVVTTTKGISANSAADEYIYADAPVVQVVSPTSGPEAGGTPVTITGTGFTTASAVMFGTVRHRCQVDVSGTEITVTSPAGTAEVDVTVTTPVGKSATSSADEFTYAPTVLNVNPNTGPETSENAGDDHGDTVRQRVVGALRDRCCHGRRGQHGRHTDHRDEPRRHGGRGRDRHDARGDLAAESAGRPVQVYAVWRRSRRRTCDCSQLLGIS